MLPTDSSLYAPLNNTPSVSTEALKQKALAYQLEPSPLALTVQPPDTFTEQTVNSSPIVKPKSKPTKETKPTSGIPLWGKLTLGMASVVIIGFLIDHFSGGNVLKVIRRPFEKTEPKSKPDPIEPKPDPTNPIPPILPPNHEPVIPDPVIEEPKIEPAEELKALQKAVKGLTSLQGIEKEEKIDALLKEVTTLSTQLAEKQLAIVKELFGILSGFVDEDWHESHRFLESQEKFKEYHLDAASNAEILELTDFVQTNLSAILQKTEVLAENQLNQLATCIKNSGLFQKELVFSCYEPDKELEPWYAYRFKLEAEMGYIRVLLQLMSLKESGIEKFNNYFERYQQIIGKRVSTFHKVSPYHDWASDVPIKKWASDNSVIKADYQRLNKIWNNHPFNQLWKKNDAQKLRLHLATLFSPSIPGRTQYNDSNTLEQKISDLKDRLLPQIKNLIQQRQKCKEVQEKLKQKLANLSQN